MRAAVVKRAGILGLGLLLELSVAGLVDGALTLVQCGEGLVAGFSIGTDAHGVLELANCIAGTFAKYAIHRTLVESFGFQSVLHLAHAVAGFTIGNGLVLGKSCQHHRQAQHKRKHKRHHANNLLFHIHFLQTVQKM